MLDLKDKDKDLLLSLIQKHLPGARVLAFGSRVTGKSNDHSDLDLAVFTKENEHEAFCNLRDEIDESDLPFCVDLLEWNTLPQNFRDNINSSCQEFAG